MTLQYHFWKGIEKKTNGTQTLPQPHSPSMWASYSRTAMWVPEAMSCLQAQTIHASLYFGVCEWWQCSGHYLWGNFTSYFMISTFGKWEEWATCSLAHVELSVHDLWASQSLLSLQSPLAGYGGACHCRIWMGHRAAWVNWDYQQL